MEATLYANLNRKTLSEKVEGNAFTWPTLTAGDTVSLRLRFTKRIEGKNQLVSLSIEDLYAAIAVVDQRPLAGSYRLKIGPLEEAAAEGTNLTTELASNADATAWQNALNALTLCDAGGDYGVAAVTGDNGSYLVTFANLEAAGVIVLAENELAPSTLLRVIPVDRDGTIEHDCRLIQAPASMTSTYSIEAGSSPTVERHRGGSSEGASINEIQILTIPPDFNGAAEFERVGGEKDGLRSAPFGKTYDLEQFEELLAPLADTDGTFALSNILPNELWIEFTGSMAATAQDLLEVHVVRAPQGDIAFTLDLNQPAVFSLLRAADNVDAYVHLVVLYEDPDTEELRRWSYLQKVKLQRPVVWNGLDVNEAIDFLKKPGDTHLPVADGQIITGSQHYTRAFPTSLELGATLFTVTHNLGEDFGHIVVGTNSSPGVRLVEGMDYSITIVSEDQFQIQLLAGGYFDTGIVVNDGGTWKFIRTSGGNVASENFLAVAFSSIGPASAFSDHDHYKTDIFGLPEDLTDIFARLAALEALAPASVSLTRSTSTTQIGRRLGSAWVLPRVKKKVEKPASLLDWRISEVELGVTPRRPLRLLPAIIDAEADALPSPLPIPSSTYAGKLYTTATARPDVPGGGLLANEYAGCDGREWYPVVRTGTDSTWHAREFEKLLFEVAISANELILGAAMDLDFGLEVMALSLEAKALTQRAQCSYSLIVEAGGRTADTTPGTPGTNLADAFASPITLLEQQIILTEIPSWHTFGITVARSAAGVLSATKRLYGEEAATTAPAAADFSVRARLHRFDTANSPADARGIVAIRGLDVGLDGQPSADLGRLVIYK